MIKDVIKQFDIAARLIVIDPLPGMLE